MTYLDLGDGLIITVDEQGDPDAGAVLLLHGGAGPRSVAGFATTLAEQAHVLTPTHPGFDGSPRPDWLDSVTDLALAYLDLLDTLDLRDVLVVGNSVGGWIASEMALHDTRGRAGRLVLVDAVGISGEIADVASLSPAELGQLSFYNPALRPDPATLTDEQRAAAAANMRTLATYAGDPYMHDPRLRRRLRRVTQPVLVVWGEADGVVTPVYGRTFAGAFPDADFELIAEAGHLPHLEQPERTLAAIQRFAKP